MTMDITNKNQTKDNRIKIIEQAAESWVRLCLLTIRQRQLVNKNQNEKEHKHKTI